jgi:hypothetical protein
MDFRFLNWILPRTFYLWSAFSALGFLAAGRFNVWRGILETFSESPLSRPCKYVDCAGTTYMLSTCYLLSNLIINVQYLVCTQLLS